MSSRSEKGKRLEAAMGEALDFMKGESKDARVSEIDVPLVNVKAVREKLSLTQDEFARRYGFSTSAVQNWEQGRRRPERAARLLLLLIRDESEVVERQLEKLRA
jgi:putative transcriptional regulator